MLGDEYSRVTELYGENYEQNGTAYIYQYGDTQLHILVQNEAVISIEYKLLMPELG